MFKKIWKIYKKSIIGSLVIIFVMIGLIYLSAIMGKFIWFTPSYPTSYVVLPGFSVWAIAFSFLVLLALFILFFWKSK